MKYPLEVLPFIAWERLVRHFSIAIGSLILKGKLRALGCTFGRKLRADGRVVVSVPRLGAIRLGERVRFNSRFGSNLVGLSQPVVLQCLGEGRIEIGDHSGMSGAVLSSRAAIVIGKRVKLGGNVRIYDHDYHALDYTKRGTSEEASCVASRPVRIGDDVLVGVNAIILKGITVGDRAIIGAGTVVSRDIPAGEIWAGNPAVCVRPAPQPPA